MNLDLRALLSENDKKTMENYINMHANSNIPCKNIDDVLREWAISKQTLYHTLGDKFTVEFPIEYNRPISDISEDCWKETVYPSKFSTFLDNLTGEFKCETNSMYTMFIHHIYNTDNMATNTINIETPILVQHKDTQKTITIRPGAKYFRALHHLVKECGGKYDNIFEEFRIRISQITNNRSLKGTMCISIHPMDFITMSDNSYGWDSCMRWIDDTGDYRMGTVEMMNSPIVVCAYLKGNEPFDFSWNRNGEFRTWNNKKWRELFVVTPELITEIKSYPYDNEEFTKAVMDTLLALSKENDGNEYDTEIYWTYSTPVNSRGTTLRFDTYENGMYNDFGCYRNRKGHLMHYNSKIMENITDNIYYITYSGAKTCMICGEYIDDYSADSKEVVCEKHGYYTTTTCSCCGRRLDSDDVFYSDYTQGEYCEECYYDMFIRDDILDEDIPVSSSVEFFLIDSSLLSDEEGIEEWRKKVSAYTSTVETMTYQFGIAPYHLSSKYYDYYCYTFEQVAQNPKIAEFFGFVLDSDDDFTYIAASCSDYDLWRDPNLSLEVYNLEEQIAIYKKYGYQKWIVKEKNCSAI